MEIHHTIEALQAALAAQRRQGRRIVLVPTMGALHAGHLSLVQLARAHGECVVMSVFVNPTQFNSRRDLETYPRELEKDIAKTREGGVDVLFAPAEEEMYSPASPGSLTCVKAGRRANGLCGATRPGHFDGVVTVVSMLFNVVAPDAAVFGEKDYQQLRVIEALVDDLHYPIRIVPAPLVREPDGLAMSSRNALLSADERRRALSISKALLGARARVARGVRRSEAIKDQVRAALVEQGLRVDYVEVVDVDTLEPLAEIEKSAQLLAAAFAGQVRLIDNVRLHVPKG